MSSGNIPSQDDDANKKAGAVQKPASLEGDEYNQNSIGNAEESTGVQLPEAMLEKLPPDLRQPVISALVASSTRIHGPMPDPLLAQAKPEHLTMMLQNSEKSDIRGHQRYFAELVFKIIVAVLMVSLICAAMYFFRNQPDILKPFLSHFGTLITGVLGGYGYGKSRGGSNANRE